MTTEPVNSVDDPLINGDYINRDLAIDSRKRRYLQKKGLIPPPDANLLGSNMWKLSNYQKFKRDLLAGKFAIDKSLRLRAYLAESKSAA